MKLSLIIPCYNEEGNVELIYDKINDTFKNSKFKYELIFINDGSSDGTYDKLKNFVNNKKVTSVIINFSRNFGKEAAIYAGLKESCGDYVCIIDADMQQDPSYVLEMVNFLDNNKDYDSVAMYQEKRKERKIMTFFKKKFYKLINKVSDTNFKSDASDFRTINRKMVNAVLSMEEYYRFSKGLFAWIGFNTYYMPYKVNDRVNGASKWSFKQLFKYALDGIVSFTTAPLNLATYVGLLSSFGSFIYLIIILIRKFCFDVMISSNAIILFFILLIGGIQLFCFGILGNYIGKSYMEIKKRPIYIEKDKLSNRR